MIVATVVAMSVCASGRHTRGASCRRSARMSFKGRRRSRRRHRPQASGSSATAGSFGRSSSRTSPALRPLSRCSASAATAFANPSWSNGLAYDTSTVPHLLLSQASSSAHEPPWPLPQMLLVERFQRHDVPEPPKVKIRVRLRQRWANVVEDTVMTMPRTPSRPFRIGSCSRARRS